MKTLIKFISAAFVAAIAQVGLSAGIIPERTYSNKLTIDVPTSAFLSEILEQRSIADLSAYDCMEKTGEGILTNDVAITSFAGDLFVKKGALVVHVNGSLGADSVKDDSGDWTRFVVVEDGATLQWGGTVAFAQLNKTVYFEGTGYNGSGALQSRSTKNQSSGGIWGRNLILTGDAMMTAYRNAQAYIADQTIEVNGFVLEVRNNNYAYTIPFGPHLVGPGTVKLTKGVVVLSADLTTEGGPQNKLVVSDLATKIQYGKGRLSGMDWTLSVQTDAQVQCIETAAPGESVWSFPIELKANLGFVGSEVDDTEIALTGAITGAGDLVVNGKDASDPETAGTGRSPGLRLANPDNAFAGQVRVSHGRLFVDSTLAVPMACEVIFAGACELGGTNSISIQTFEIADGGTVALNRVHDYFKPGLWYGYDPTVTWGTGKSLGGTYKPDVAYSNEVVLALEKTHQGAVMPDDANEKGSLYTYSGYIMNTDAVERTWSFAGTAKYRSRLLVNGQEVYGQSASATVIGEATLRPGANTFLFQGATQTAAAGSITSGTTAPFKSCGLLIKRQEDADWEIPVETGDGTLFRVATGRAEMAEIGFDFPYAIRLANATFGSGARLDVGGWDVEIGNMTGVPTVVNAAGSEAGNAFTVTGKWLVPGAALAGNTKMTYDRALTFGAASILGFDDAKAVRRAYGNTLSLLETTEAFEGMPTPVADAQGVLRWKLVKGADGRTLTADYQAPGLMLIFK